MEYIKFNIDEMNQEQVFFEYREFTEEDKGPIIRRAFPLEKIETVEPRIREMVSGSIVGVYYEQRGDLVHTETQYINKTIPMEEEDIQYAIDLTKKVCLDEAYDELLKPPTVDQQVEDFIKEFFEDDADEEKDFLSEFFDEDNKQGNVGNQIDKEFENKTAESKDFLAEFFAELETEEESNSKE